VVDIAVEHLSSWDLRLCTYSCYYGNESPICDASIFLLLVLYECIFLILECHISQEESCYCLQS